MRINCILTGVLFLISCPYISAEEPTISSDPQIVALQKQLDILNLKNQVEEVTNKLVTTKKNGYLANIPNIDTLEGKVDIKDYGLFGAVTALDASDNIARNICSLDDFKSKFYINDSSVSDGINNAILVDEQLTSLLTQINSTLENIKIGSVKNPEKNKTSSVEPIGVAAEVIMNIIAASRTNISVSKTEISDPKVNLIKSLEKYCQTTQIVQDTDPKTGVITEKTQQIPAVISTNIFNIRNEIKDPNGIYAKFIKLIEDQARLEVRMNSLNKKSNDFSTLSALNARAKSTIESLQNGTGNNSLINILKYKNLSNYLKESNANILDINIKQEGFPIIKENAFTGQSLRVSAVTIVTYSLYNSESQLIKSGIYRTIDEPVKINLRKSRNTISYGFREVGVNQ
ncbi:hypothetical protein [Acinetobacter calcoaceticus]|uniref:hypothetical protein n=1 Tax=Acinetobacter calcoaceticus TaxID=471 RepID=UPI001AE98B68|nr:hypothetical protein [Acinetobacter calcoaceticus]MBP2603659.1 hypothetical protein [Acinetobacter calcoaceticus]